MIVALPEFATVPYFCAGLLTPTGVGAEAVDGPLAGVFAAFAREGVLFFPFYERESDGPLPQRSAWFRSDGEASRWISCS